MDLLHLLLTTAPPGRNCRPCFTDEQMGPRRGIHRPQVTARTWQSWCLPGFPDGSILSSLPPPGPPGVQAPVWSETLSSERVSK